MTYERPDNVPASSAPLDAIEGGDHDQPYRFGWRPRASAPYPFNTRQYARLLVFRSRVQYDLTRARADNQRGSSPTAA
jgi:hypothetical protein